MVFILALLSIFGCVPAHAATPVVDFTVPVMNGEPDQQYNSANGKPILIEFYFNDCPACNNNAANVKAIANDFNNEVTHVVEFSYDCEASDYSSWIRRHTPTAFVLYGCDHGIFDELNVHSFPTTIILDANRNVVARYVGTWSSRTKTEIRNKMVELSQ